MRRRDVIAGLLFTATIGRSQAQKSAETYRLAVVHPSNPVAELTETGSPRFAALFKELRRLGYIEGQNIVVERFSGEGRTEHYAELAREVVRRKPEVIIAITSRMVLNFKIATATTPIVGLMGDPVAFGIVESLARPGGNITGVSTDAGPEIWGKRLALLREVVPGASRAAFLASRAVWESPLGVVALKAAAEQMEVSIIGPPLEGTIQEQEYRRVFEAMIHDRPDALIVSDQAENFTHRPLIVELATKSRLPALFPYREYVEVGGLMAYAPDLPDLYRRAAGYVGQILNGAKPSEIPIYLASKFELAVNTTAAKAIGLTVPPSLLARADEVIE